MSSKNGSNEEKRELKDGNQNHVSVVSRALNPSTPEAEAGGSLCVEPTWFYKARSKDSQSWKKQNKTQTNKAHTQK